jgi:hypothetical protein
LFLLCCGSTHIFWKGYS